MISLILNNVETFKTFNVKTQLTNIYNKHIVCFGHVTLLHIVHLSPCLGKNCVF